MNTIIGPEMLFWLISWSRAEVGAGSPILMISHSAAPSHCATIIYHFDVHMLRTVHIIQIDPISHSEYEKGKKRQQVQNINQAKCTILDSFSFHPKDRRQWKSLSMKSFKSRTFVLFFRYVYDAGCIRGHLLPSKQTQNTAFHKDLS